METNSNSQKEVVDLSHIYQMSLIWLWVGIGAVSSEFPQAHLTLNRGRVSVQGGGVVSEPNFPAVLCGLSDSA